MYNKSTKYFEYLILKEWIQAYIRVKKAITELELEVRAGFNATQPRVPAGSSEGGRWSSGENNGDITDGHVSDNLTGVGFTDFNGNDNFNALRYPNKSPIINPNTNRPYPKPKGLDIPSNVEKGKSASLIDMYSWFKQFGSMDYQRSTGNFIKGYRDVTNYNYGAVAAASGRTKSQALFAAGSYNIIHGNKDGHLTVYGILPDAVRNITQGWNDYHKGIFDRNR